MSPTLLMKALAGLCFVATLGTAVSAAEPSPNREHDYVLAGCRAWHYHLEMVSGWMIRTGALSDDDATATSDTIARLGERCKTDDPQKISHLFVRLLDHLTDPENQP